MRGVPGNRYPYRDSVLRRSRRDGIHHLAEPPSKILRGTQNDSEGFRMTRAVTSDECQAKGEFRRRKAGKANGPSPGVTHFPVSVIGSFR